MSLLLRGQVIVQKTPQSFVSRPVATVQLVCILPEAKNLLTLRGDLSHKAFSVLVPQVTEA